MNWPALLAFAEAFLTVLTAGLGGVMLHSVSGGGTIYVWPAAPALVFFALGGLLAGVRRVQSLYSAPPR